MNLKSMMLTMAALLVSLFLFIKLLPIIFIGAMVIGAAMFLRKVRYPRIKTSKPNRHVTKYKGGGSFINKDELVKRH